MKAGLVPRLVRMRHAHSWVQGLGRRVHFGNERRLSGFLRGNARRVGKQAAVFGRESRGRWGGGRQAKRTIACARRGC